MKLIAIDMDGTLFNSNHVIPQGNLDAIKEAQEAGHIVMLCSGRPHDALQQFMEKNYGLDLPLSGSNGAVTFTEGKMIHRSAMSKELASQIFEYLESGKHPFKIYTNQGVFTIDAFVERAREDFDKLLPEEIGDASIERFIEFFKNTKSTFIKNFDELSDIEGLEIFKFFVSTFISQKKSEIESRMEAIKGLGFTSSGIHNVEIMGEHGHKGTGLSEMAKHYGIPMENTIAIGDNFNDVPMMKAAGLSIAMANAEEDVKALCDVVTKSNDEEGVAYAIRNYVLK